MPKSKVSIDESLRVFEGPAPAIQYMSNKHHHHFGFKLFSSCESDTGYTVNFSIYERKSNTASEYGTSNDVWIQLMGPLLGMGYHLYTDNWYTTVPLAESLLSEGTNLTGTVWGNQKYLPKGVGWQDKKHEILLSTEGLSKMITYTSKHEKASMFRNVLQLQLTYGWCQFIWYEVLYVFRWA